LSSCSLGQKNAVTRASVPTIRSRRSALNRSVGDRSAYDPAPCPRTVELTEEHALPGRQAQLPVNDRYGFRRADEAGLQVCIAVAVFRRGVLAMRPKDAAGGGSEAAMPPGPVDGGVRWRSTAYLRGPADSAPPGLRRTLARRRRYRVCGEDRIAQYSFPICDESEGAQSDRH
jgi:hypothetical protein